MMMVVMSGVWWFVCVKMCVSKVEGEMFCLKYLVCWIVSVGVVIVMWVYELFGCGGYLAYCGACAALVIVVLLMCLSVSDWGKVLSECYIVKVNVWIVVFSFIGNYWYMYYFYAVFKAEYTFDAYRLNDVLISMYFMMYVYFMFYYVLLNVVLWWIWMGYVNDVWCFGFECVVVGAMAYSTAFMESLIICGFLYYFFVDWYMVYMFGLVFYGIYFLVLFLMFLCVDEMKVMLML